ncbi:prephenate dehydratase [Allopseudospirillum japonicum]|uniref:prephenate dehydratase n=1 Tax=Allopseudospirillum japonicum TaxID=64971 RepID=A0A1H6SBB5_9GAMM|nr:prephenate dehydratase [Allopseudospirillum japonicum]SEI61310.1 prephenate dehydratase [Allopseudospirillum japonicum]
MSSTDQAKVSPQIIAYQGHEGAYSHLACRNVFPEAQALAYPSFEQAMQAVVKQEAQVAMIPIENSTAGRVEEIYRALPKAGLFIIGEYFQPIHHCLLALPEANPTEIHTVASHPQALAQCARHIQALGLVAEAASDTAGAAKALAQANNLHQAAIASSIAAELYGLKILESQFQDEDTNTTRFVILANCPIELTYQVKTPYLTSLLFKVRNLPAALYKSLGGFATNGINMVKLESYMDRRTFTATEFYLEVEAHPQDPAMQRALEELGFFAEDVRLLGSYHPHILRYQYA